MSDLPSGANLWILGARPRTLPAAVVPVIVGTAAAADSDLGSGRGIEWWRVALVLVVSLALQVGVNYANDYSDGKRGTDDDRVGPVRLVGSKLVEAKFVKRAAFIAFAVAAAAGLGVAAAAGWWLVLVGLGAILAAWFYTGGPNPYGYLGLGEVFVFVFFGLVATVGSSYVQLESFDGLSLAVAVPVGLLATALLVTNNLRDIPTDTLTGKRTLAVRLGDARTRSLYIALLAGSGVGVVLISVAWRLPALLGLVAVPLALRSARRVSHGAAGAALIPVLETTGRMQIVFGVGLAVGLWIGA
jgi:1,4-dihydroxy-2-naphthoate polyprenyltransferase